MCICVVMYLRMCSMIACSRLKLDLGGVGESDATIRCVIKGGGQNRNITFRYVAGRGRKMTEISVM